MKYWRVVVNVPSVPVFPPSSPPNSCKIDGMDQILRGIVYISIGLVLLMCNAYYVRALLALRSDEFTILPISVVRTAGADSKDTKAVGADGVALSQLLQARIQSIEKDMGIANDVLLSSPERTSNVLTDKGGFASGIAAFMSPLDPVRLPTAVLSPSDVKITVSGIEVGGWLSWIESKISERRGLSYAIYLTGGNEKKLASANLSVISGKAGDTEWFESEAPVGEIIADLAYATVKARLSQTQRSRMEALSVAEFETLVRSISSVSVLNRRIQSGITTEPGDFKEVAKQLLSLAAKARNWPELSYMTAVVEERAEDYDRAAQLYRLVQNEVAGASPVLAKAISTGEIVKCIARVDIRRSRVPMPKYTEADIVRAKSTIDSVLADVWPAYEALFQLKLVKPGIRIINEVNSYWKKATNEIWIGPMWEKMPDVVYHDAAMPFVERYIGADRTTTQPKKAAPQNANAKTKPGWKDSIDTDPTGSTEFSAESEAVKIAYAASLASWYKQKKAGQVATNADWVLCPGAVAWIYNDRAKLDLPLRSLKSPGSAFPGDSQVADYKSVREGVHREPHATSGVGSKAFYEVAINVGTERAIRLWLDALTKLDQPTFPALANATIASADAMHDATLARVVRQAWTIVDIQP